VLHGLSTIARITVLTVVRAVVVLSVAALVFVGLGPRFGGYRVLTVLTGSMRPYARPGDLVVDRKVSLSELHVGDVITYQAPVDDHQVISHRIIEVRNPGPHPTIRTKGDANNGPDPWVATLSAGPGWRVSYVVPGAGHVIRFLRTSHVHTATTRLMPLLLAALWLVAIWTPSREPTSDTATVG
jgi:signal peptidase